LIVVGKGRVHRLRLRRSFVKIWRVAGCEILEIGEQIWGGYWVAKCRVREPFLAKSLMEESAEPTLDFSRLIGRSFVNR
jgi:hypothetical protein